jgi:hypothetical protein
MEADNSSEVSEDTTQYCSIGEAMKLIAHLFDGDKRKLKEFIENVDVVFELVDPSKHDILLKFVKAKITGDAQSKLMVQDLTHSWELVKAILEENYATRRYACKILDALGNSGYFSTVDCASGFLQVPVKLEDQAKTAFSTREGHFQYTRMSFGLKGAPTTFQSLMTTILSGIQGIKCLVILMK